jgi:hypothetical protein
MGKPKKNVSKTSEQKPGSSTANSTPKNKRRRKVHDDSPKNDATENNSSDSEISSEDENQDGERNNIMKMLREIQESQRFISDKFDIFEKKLEQVLVDNKKMKEEITSLNQKVDFQQTLIDGLNTEVNVMKQRFLEKDVVISGLPDLNNISCETIAQSIDRVYNFGMQNISKIFINKGFSKYGKTTYNNIIISFCNTAVKEQVLNKQKMLGPILWGQLLNNTPENLCAKRIFIAERLTPHNLLLLNACRDLRTKKKITFAWSKFGTVLIKIKPDSNVIKILSANDMKKLESNLTVIENE